MDNIYYRIYQQKTTDELKAIILNVYGEMDSKLISIRILEERGEINDDIAALKLELDKKRQDLLSNEIAADRYDTFSARFVANMIDGFLFRMVGFVVVHVNISDSLIGVKILTAVSIFFPYLYSILLHGLTGQTIGKMAMGIKIFDKDEKVRISFYQAFLRDAIPLGLILVFWFASTLNPSVDPESLSSYSILLVITIFIWALLEIITLLFNKKRRALHDFIAGTVVLKIRN